MKVFEALPDIFCVIFSIVVLNDTQPNKNWLIAGYLLLALTAGALFLKISMTSEAEIKEELENEEKNNKIKELEEINAAKDDKIKELEEINAAKDDKIKELGDNSKAKDNRIKELEKEKLHKENTKN